MQLINCIPKLIRLLLLVTGTFIFANALSQSINNESFILNESLIESLQNENSESGNYESILLELEYLKSNPLDLNKINRDDLQKLYFLTDFQINSLLEYRNANGRFLTIYELQAVYGFTDEIIELMLPFVFVSDKVSTADMNKKPGMLKQEFSIRTQRVLEKSKGYSVYDSVSNDMHYPGSPWLINLHYEMETKDLTAGFTMEKDAGETLFRSSNKNGFDFNSGFLIIKNKGIFKTTIFGDYRLVFGQGLTLWSGSSTGKSALPLNIVKRQNAIKAFTSNDENNFFRGLATNLEYKNFGLITFFSYKRKDANLTDTTENDIINFSSFQESGYHRTHSEIKDEKSLQETAFGGHLMYRNNYFKIGTTLAFYKFDKYLEQEKKPENIFDFRGNHLLNYGIDYSVSLKKVQLFGETTYGNKNLATLNGMLVNINKYATFSFLYRYYDKRFFSLNAEAFSEKSGDQNETGFYFGLVLTPVSKVKISGYADFYRFPWLRYNTSSPSTGSDYLLDISYKPGRNTDMYVRLKVEYNPCDETSDTIVIPSITEQKITSLRYHISYSLSESFAMQNRIEMVNSKTDLSGNSYGFLIYHDTEYKMVNFPLTVDFRIGWFNTNDFKSRIYAYEHDLASGFAFSPLYGRGFRSYILISLKLTNNISSSVRFANTWYNDRSSSGSGYDEISSNMKNDIKFRIILRF